MDKTEIRRGMRERNRSMDEKGRQAAASRIFGRVENLELFRKAHTVALFSALKDEPATDDVLQRWALQRRIVLPRVEGEDMEFYDYRPEQMAGGSFGIMEPQQGTPCDPAEIDLIIVPGVAFTPSGCRLGRGRGYYDKYLSRKDFRAAKIGVCYLHQLVDELPTEPHDVKMDCVVAG